MHPADASRCVKCIHAGSGSRVGFAGLAMGETPSIRCSHISLHGVSVAEGFFQVHKKRVTFLPASANNQCFSSKIRETPKVLARVLPIFLPFHSCVHYLLMSLSPKLCQSPICGTSRHYRSKRCVWNSPARSRGRVRSSMSPALVKRLTAVKVIALRRAFSPCCFQKLAQIFAHDFFHHPSRGLTNLCSQILMKVLLTQGLGEGVGCGRCIVLGCCGMFLRVNRHSSLLWKWVWNT
jgi:hypothetical protein